VFAEMSLSECVGCLRPRTTARPVLTVACNISVQLTPQSRCGELNDGPRDFF
jgi:hypothetical protein